MMSILRHKEDEGTGKPRQRRMRDADIEQTVVRRSVGADAEAAAVSLPDLDREEIRLAANRLAAVERGSVAAQVHMVEQLIDARLQIEHRARLPRSCAAFDGIERNCRVQTERQRLQEPSIVAFPHVMRAQFAIAQLQDRRGKVGRHAERARVVVARADRQQCESRPLTCRNLHEPAGDLVCDAVAAERADAVEPARCGTGGDVARLPRALGELKCEGVFP